MHKGGQINNVQLITGVRIAEMSQLQNCSVMCTKKGSYCEKEKKVRGGGNSRCKWRSEAFVKLKKKSRGGVGLGLGEGSGDVRVDVNGEVTLFLNIFCGGVSCWGSGWM